jgi:ATP-dependent DNA ligase
MHGGGEPINALVYRLDTVTGEIQTYVVMSPKFIDRLRPDVGKSSRSTTTRWSSCPGRIWRRGTSKAARRAAAGRGHRVEQFLVIPRYTPMAPTLVRAPFHREGWVYEEKVDGWRMFAYKDRDRVRLVSRHGRDHTRRFRDIAAAVAKLSARSLVIDGEVAIYDQQLRSRFDWLREPDPDAIATPPMFIAFDVLHRDGRDLIGRPLRERRARLEDAVADNDLVLPVRRLARNGFEAWSEVIARDYEGYVAKDVKAELGCPENTEVRCPLFTDLRVT